MTIRLGSVEGALSSSDDNDTDATAAECMEAVVDGGVEDESSVTRVKTCPNEGIFDPS